MPSQTLPGTYQTLLMLLYASLGRLRCVSKSSEPRWQLGLQSPAQHVVAMRLQAFVYAGGWLGVNFNTSVGELNGVV